MTTSINITAEKLIPKVGNGSIRVGFSLGIIIMTLLLAVS